jgi:hypothetical protein
MFSLIIRYMFSLDTVPRNMFSLIIRYMFSLDTAPRNMFSLIIRYMFSLDTVPRSISGGPDQCQGDKRPYVCIKRKVIQTQKKKNSKTLI